jgi:hypothetical protein
VDNGGLRYGAMESALRPPLPTATQALAELQIQPWLDQRLRAKHHRRDPRKQTPGGRHQIGTPAGFKSVSVAGFLLECVAGFVGIRTLTRRQELDGFGEGLFGRDEMIDPPQRAQRGLDKLGQMRALFEAVVVLTADDAQLLTDKGMETTLRHLRETTKNAEQEIHAVVVACSRARRQLLIEMARSNPTLH